MLPRLEVDGFKNLVGFTADFSPYTCIAGPNGTGKSNIFDAIHFLSLLANHSILDAAVRVRARTEDTARLDDLFFRMELRSESLHQIGQGDARKRLRFPHSKSAFRDRAVRNRRRAKSGYVSTEQGKDGTTEIIVHQDGGSRGPGQRAAAHTAPRTIVGTSNTVATPTILAARREMQKRYDYCEAEGVAPGALIGGAREGCTKSAAVGATWCA